MAIPLRHADPLQITAGARTFFVTSSICGRRNLLQSDRSAKLFVRVLYGYRAQGKFRLHEFVVMPDHFHVLLTVECEMTIERAVQFKGGFAFRAGRELGFSAPVWQKGSRKCAFKMPMHSYTAANTSGIIHSRVTLQPMRRNIHTPRLMRDLNSTQLRRG